MDGTSAVETRLLVAGLTGTLGDDLVAWGLALFVSELAARDVTLRSVPQGTEVVVSVDMEDLLGRCDSFEPGPRLATPWLASSEKDRMAPPDVREVRDRDRMREDYKKLQEAGKAGADQPVGDDAPPVVATVPGARLYPLFKTLTSPGTQWGGYNKFAEAVQHKLMCPSGYRLIVGSYRQDAEDGAGSLDGTLKALGLGTGDRWRNPPGFLFPGLNKGPTMRLATSSGHTVGKVSQPDWTLADRGDRDIVQLYLAYVGYFLVARVLDSDDGRVVLAPSPADARVPAVFSSLDAVTPRYSTIEDYLLATTSLAYAVAALTYWQGLAHVSRLARYPQVFAGVNTAIFWKPNANTFAPRRQTLAPLPVWLAALREQTDYGTARDTLELHRRQLSAVRGPWRDERTLAGECRDAIASYVVSLTGNARDWLTAVRRWFPAARSTAPVRAISLWTIPEIERILMALNPEDNILSIIQDESFRRLANAVRSSTVYPHFARLHRRRQGGETLAFDPDYELVTQLEEAAERSPDEFLEKLYRFVVQYNDRTMRRNEEAERRNQPRRAMVREEDLVRLTEWVLADRRGLVPVALLAFGTSRAPRRQEQQEAAHEGVEPEVVQSLDSADVEVPVEEPGAMPKVEIS